MTKKKAEKVEKVGTAGWWRAEPVAKAFCVVDGVDPNHEVVCAHCSVRHQLWERNMLGAERFVAAFDVLMSLGKEKLN